MANIYAPIARKHRHMVCASKNMEDVRYVVPLG